MLPGDPAGAVTICQQLLQQLPDQQVMHNCSPAAWWLVLVQLYVSQQFNQMLL
jgi:hypothetical protein